MFLMLCIHSLPDKHGRICGRRCLGPMKFLSRADGNAEFLASRDTSSRPDSLVFLCRPVKVNEKIRIQMKSVMGRSSQDGHRAIRIGFTNDSPLSARRGLRDSPRSCAVPLPEDLCPPGAEIEFWMNYAFFVIIQASDRRKYYMKAEGLNLHEPLFVFLDFSGSTSTVHLLGSRKGGRRSCSALPSGTKAQALEENLLNLSLIADDNTNSDPAVFREASPWQAHHPPTHTHPPESTQRSDPTTHSKTAVKRSLKRRLQSSVETDVTSLLRAFQQQHLSSNEVHVTIWRKSLLKSALGALCNRNFSWTKKPHIEFAGEEAFDNGGPRREFFRLLMLEVQSSLGIFEGNPKHLFFTYDQTALQQRKYEQAGKLVAWSVVHGGPGLKALDAHLYQLMCGVEMELSDFDWHLIPDADVQRKARKVLSCKTAKHLCALQRELGDWICDCGFPGIYGPNIGIQDVPKIYSHVVRHYIYLRVLNMINQFTEGLNSCGNLWDIVKINWIDFLPIFTKTNERLSRASFRALFEISWSAEGSKRREDEEETIYYWELVLKMIEDKETELHFEELLVFITATDEVPVLGFPEKLSIHFYQPEKRGFRLPYTSTCMMGLFLPRGVKSHAELNTMLLRAVRDSNGFGKS
ncbi:G2/M phase-specific E3 ubiquitin-protein ligase isoform X2 [Ictalurus punctatus]|uniref:HECT-type E3 ubiquitin transferase n=1 Tax=Ictalurus punctatus TaxID=7998 RepID=A0A2D0QYI4_ICTPU|nr:G2/M phase-specific E3 ubiquitin-protein ligase isoform X2 [Ictalurus punctatus]